MCYTFSRPGTGKCLLSRTRTRAEGWSSSNHSSARVREGQLKQVKLPIMFRPVHTDLVTGGHKEVARLSRQRDMLLGLLGDANPLNAKKKIFGLKAKTRRISL